MPYKAENIESSYLALSAEKPLQLIDNQLIVAVFIIGFTRKISQIGGLTSGISGDHNEDKFQTEAKWKEPGAIPSSFQFRGTTSLLGRPLFSRHQGFS